ncbi:MAG: hypothetical protein N2Z70_07180 [Bdellovibrionaceae bacterium]|nr:hypothetical protein [Pseudobdellovibrionaceae bacterium]
MFGNTIYGAMRARTQIQILTLSRFGNIYFGAIRGQFVGHKLFDFLERLPTRQAGCSVSF